MGGDKPADEDNGDYLGYGVYAQTLWNRVEAALNKDQGNLDKLGDDPLVVGIFGEWGAGKSKLLKLILEKAEKLASQKERARSGKDGGFGDAGFSLTVPVFFQPWKYEHEENLLVPLLLHIVQSLQETARRGQTPGEELRQKAQIAGDVAFAALPDIVEGFEVLHNNVAVDLALAADPTGSAALLKTAGWLAKLKRKTGLPQTSLKRDFRVTTDGRFYYNFHAALKDITRPSGKPAVLEKLRLTKGLRINFVIFIDDLDRCLPEKAVETLELIKTVFNLESFAFVLALDEEVVERGIGHRYRDYALVNKKPEMPITGFEYLEKIVHLPFRLPALTAGQARQFLERHERELLKEQADRRWPNSVKNPEAAAQKTQWVARRTWFSLEAREVALGSYQLSDHDQMPEVLTEGQRGFNKGGNKETSALALNLSHLVLGCFDAYVPRKLIRIVELFVQVQNVLEEQKPNRFLKLGTAFDPRLILSLLLIQIFQPDLYRALRRIDTGFATLLASFEAPGEQDKTDFPAIQALTNATADADLLHWAVYWVDADPPVSLRSAHMRVAKLIPTKRFYAQRLRLPLVERLLEHRAVQRHPFDALKLFQQLHLSGQPGQLPLPSLSGLFSLLAGTSDQEDPIQLEVVVKRSLENRTQIPEDDDLENPNAVPADLAPFAFRTRHTGFVEAPNVNALFMTLVAPDEAVQKTVAKVAGLLPGQALGSRSARALIDQIEREFLLENLRGEGAGTLEGRRNHVAQGLHYLAPHVAVTDRPAFWALVKNLVPDDLFKRTKAFETTSQILQYARIADLCSAFWAEDRFDEGRWHLPKQRFNEPGGIEEPLVGFVRVPKGPFTLGAEGKGFEDNPLDTEASIHSDFYIARYLTTVDQYAHFVAAQGYGDPVGEKPGWWDTLGWNWRTGQWDSKVKDKALREHLARRKPELRGSPMGWSEQLAHGSRPVMRLNWFEARAYASWLTVQLKEELARSLPGYAVRLPTEAQWERAARAKDLSSAEDRQYPWGGADEKTAHLHANIRASGIDRASPVGLFAPNPLGLCDLSGNLWEWQNNLYRPDGSGQEKGLVSNVIDLKTADNLMESDLTALRGGAWYGTAVNARASFRVRVRPDSWFGSVGFRVVLSLPN